MEEELFDEKLLDLFNQPLYNEGETKNGGIDDVDDLEYIIQKII